MAQDKNAAVKEIAETMRKQTSKKTERTFPVSTLKGECMKLFGCTSSTFDGAFYGRKEKECTIADAKKIITDWLKKGVK